jgi:predicted neutral ceramidase superfamily lipid hydrolase
MPGIDSAPQWMPWVWTVTSVISTFIIVVAVPWGMKADRRLTTIEVNVQHWAKKERALEELYKRIGRLEQQMAAVTGKPGSGGGK